MLVSLNKREVWNLVPETLEADWFYDAGGDVSGLSHTDRGYLVLAGGTILLGLGLALGERIEPTEVSARSAASLAYLAALGGIVAYSAYVWLLKVSTPARVSTYAYVNPVVAVILGWALGGEELGPRVLVASVAVVSAVVLITVSPKTAR